MTREKGPLLILGATGRLGGLVRSVWPQDTPTLWQSRMPQDGYVACDILEDANGLAHLMEGARAVVCLAGVTDKHARDTGASLRDNSRLAQATVQAAARGGVPRVFLASSAAVYGRAQSPLTEETIGTDPSPYGQAKHEMEQAACALGDAQGVEVCNLRIGNVAGADAILGDWHPGFMLDTFADGATPRRSYIGPVSLAKVIVALSSAKNSESCLNVAAPGAIAMGDLLDAAGLNWVPRIAPEHAIDCVMLETSKLDRYLNLPRDAATASRLVAEWKRTIEQETAAQ
ncbi:MAG: NAD(P)-dependent oxidoreductase [Roseobacter sp.]